MPPSRACELWLDTTCCTCCYYCCRRLVVGVACQMCRLVLGSVVLVFGMIFAGALLLHLARIIFMCASRCWFALRHGRLLFIYSYKACKLYDLQQNTAQKQKQQYICTTKTQHNNLVLLLRHTNLYAYPFKVLLRALLPAVFDLLIIIYIFLFIIINHSHAYTRTYIFLNFHSSYFS